MATARMPVTIGAPKQLAPAGDKNRSDKNLVLAAQSGESTAFSELCHRHTQQLFRAAFRVTRNREDAEDAVQEALLNAFVHVTDFDGRSSFATWLTRIAINSALMILRKKRTSQEIAIESQEEDGTLAVLHQVPDRAPTPEGRYAQREREGILKKAIDNLRPSLGQVVKIQHLQERSIRETAQMVGISVAAAKARLFHAKAALRRSPRLRLMYQTRLGYGSRALTAA